MCPRSIGWFRQSHLTNRQVSCTSLRHYVAFLPRPKLRGSPKWILPMLKPRQSINSLNRPGNLKDCRPRSAYKIKERETCSGLARSASEPRSHQGPFSFGTSRSVDHRIKAQIDRQELEGIAMSKAREVSLTALPAAGAARGARFLYGNLTFSPPAILARK